MTRRFNMSNVAQTTASFSVQVDVKVPDGTYVAELEVSKLHTMLVKLRAIQYHIYSEIRDVETDQLIARIDLDNETPVQSLNSKYQLPFSTRVIEYTRSRNERLKGLARRVDKEGYFEITSTIS